MCNNPKPQQPITTPDVKTIKMYTQGLFVNVYRTNNYESEILGVITHSDEFNFEKIQGDFALGDFAKLHFTEFHRIQRQSSFAPCDALTEGIECLNIQINISYISNIGWCPLFSKCRNVKYLYAIRSVVAKDPQTAYVKHLYAISPFAKDPLTQFAISLHTVPKSAKLDASLCFNYPLKRLNHDFSLKKESLVSLKDCFVVGNRDNKVGVQRVVSLNCLKGHNLIKSKSLGKTCDVCLRTNICCDFLWYCKHHHILHNPNHHHH